MLVRLAILVLASASAFEVGARPRLAALRGGVAMQAEPAALVAVPPAGYAGAVAAGKKKASASASQIFKLGVLAGAHVRASPPA